MQSIKLVVIDPIWDADKIIKEISVTHKVPEILIKSLFELNRKTGVDSQFLLDLEIQVISFIQKENVDSWKLTPMNSYYRLLTHKLAEYYQLGHILANNGHSMVLFKKNTSLVNADEQTKKHAEFDASGNIKPLKFEDLEFNAGEKLSRVTLKQIWDCYKDRVAQVLNDQIASEFNQLNINTNYNEHDNDNDKREVKIMKRAMPIDSIPEPPITTSETPSSEVTKEEHYEIVKQRLEKEQENESFDEEYDENGYEINEYNDNNDSGDDANTNADVNANANANVNVYSHNNNNIAGNNGEIFNEPFTNGTDDGRNFRKYYYPNQMYYGSYNYGYMVPPLMPMGMSPMNSPQQQNVDMLTSPMYYMTMPSQTGVTDQREEIDSTNYYYYPPPPQMPPSGPSAYGEAMVPMLPMMYYNGNPRGNYRARGKSRGRGYGAYRGRRPLYQNAKGNVHENGNKNGNMNVNNYNDSNNTNNNDRNYD